MSTNGGRRQKYPKFTHVVLTRPPMGRDMVVIPTPPPPGQSIVTPPAPCVKKEKMFIMRVLSCFTLTFVWCFCPFAFSFRDENYHKRDLKMHPTHSTFPYTYVLPRRTTNTLRYSINNVIVHKHQC